MTEKPDVKDVKHELVIEFHRALNEQEWREVADYAWRTPHRVALRIETWVDDGRTISPEWLTIGQQELVSALVMRWRQTGYALVKLLRMTDPAESVVINREFETQLRRLMDAHTRLQELIHQRVVESDGERRVADRRARA